jgi:hypothetical protein
MDGSTFKMLATMGATKMRPTQEHSNDATNPLDSPQLRPKADMGEKVAEMLNSHTQQHSPMD